MKKEMPTGVIPTQGLLSEMEALVIYGGKAGGVASPDDVNIYCKGAKCQCTIPGGEPDPELKVVNDCNTYCGEDTYCSCSNS